MRRTRGLIAIAALALVLAACGGGEGTTTTSGGGTPGEGDPVAGAQVYSQTCAACHGKGLEGIDGLGKALAPNNDFVQDSSVDDLVAFLLEGRPADHPDNDTGVDMPPKGGNPALSEQDLADVASYLKAQNG